MEISIVIPAYNEEGNITPLYEKIIESLSKITNKYEIIYVDDGSTDMTANNVEALHKKDSKVHLIQFRKIFDKVKIHDSDCNFRVMRKELAKDLLFYGGLFRYIPSLANWKGYKVTEEPVEHQKRFSGKAKFKSLGRLVKGFLDLITTTFLIKYRN